LIACDTGAGVNFKPYFFIITHVTGPFLMIYTFLSGNYFLILVDHTGAIHGIEFAPEGSLRLLSASQDGSLKLWDIEDDGNMSHTFRNKSSQGMMGCAWSPDGKMICGVGKPRSVSISLINISIFLRSFFD